MPRDTDYHLMGKRRFMKALSKLGLSATAVSQMSKSTLARLTDDPKKAVPRVKYVNGPAIDHDPEDGFVEYEDAEVEYYTIPRDEWVYTQSRYEAGQKLVQQFSNEGIQPAGIYVVVKTLSGQNEKVVSVRINRSRRKEVLSDGVSVESIKNRVPEEVPTELEYGGKRVTKNVPVIVEEGDPDDEDEPDVSEEVSTEGGAYYDFKYRPVPGGCKIRTQKPDDDWSRSTGGIRAYDEERGEYVYVISGHAVDGEDGQTVAQRHIDEKIGTTDKAIYKSRYHWSRMDAATVVLDDGIETTAEQAENDGGYLPEPVVGYVHTDWLEDNEGGGETIRKFGKETGPSSGDLDEVSVSRDFFTVDGAFSASGDSGGPYYYDSGNYFYVAGIHRGETGDDEPMAVVAQNIMDEFDLSFGNPLYPSP